jgi:hypothetical protein
VSALLHGTGWVKTCWRNPKHDGAARRQAQRGRGYQAQSKGIVGPNGVIVVIVRVNQFHALRPRGRRRQMKVRVQETGVVIMIMIVVRSGWVHVLKRRDKKCQQSCQACL